MTVEVLPVGLSCNLACGYCYQEPLRDAKNQGGGGSDVDAMLEGLAAEGHQFTVFGGEPLLTSINDLERLWKWGYERYGQNGVQTSASVVTERHWELFSKYNVSVGISLDGPGELNDARQVRGSSEKTREATLRAEAVLERMLMERRPTSLIVTLHRLNASPERLPRLLEWLRELDRRGLQNANLHLMEVESEAVRERLAVTAEQNATALIACAELQSGLRRLRFQPITDMVQLLLARDQWDGGGVSCIWSACDPYTTRAVRGVNGHGERVNCSRTNKAGVDMQKADSEMLVRQLALYHAPQDKGGCSGCRFFFACKGNCPGEGIGRDWRNKTEHCGALILTFEWLERRLSSLGFRPVSLDDERRKRIEANMLDAFRRGVPISVRDADRGVVSLPVLDQGHGDKAHGDAPHGDHGDEIAPIVTHGDHTDAA